jgi:hypothetical protein
MKLLYLYRFKPREGAGEEVTKKLSEMMSKDNEVKEFRLYEENSDYDKVVDMIWEADKTISWW